MPPPVQPWQTAAHGAGGFTAALLALTLLAPQLKATPPSRSPQPASSAGADARPSPSRATTGAGVWTTSYAQMLAFLEAGTLADRSLAVLVARSGWQAEPLRRALIKPYSIDLVLLEAYLRSAEGELLLRSRVGSYAPFAAPARAMEGLRSALLADASDGTLSAAGIMGKLPTDFRLARFPGELSGAMPVCAPDLGAEPGQDEQIDGRLLERRRTSLLSWYAFLPACLQESSYRNARSGGLRSPLQPLAPGAPGP